MGIVKKECDIDGFDSKENGFSGRALKEGNIKGNIDLENSRPDATVQNSKDVKHTPKHSQQPQPQPSKQLIDYSSFILSPNKQLPESKISVKKENDRPCDIKGNTNLGPLAPVTKNKVTKNHANTLKIIKPREYLPITFLLFERNKSLSINADAPFKDLTDKNEVELCQKFAQFDLDEWLDYGDSLVLEHQKLIHELAKLRVELSYKFQIITDVINDRADTLIQQSDHIDDKLKQIKDIAKNILNVL